MGSTMGKTIIREIKGSLSRYLAILAIIALGVGFFAGLRITKPSMVETVESYLTEHGFFDYRMLSTLGFTEEEVQAIVEVPGVKSCEGSISQDVLCVAGDGSEIVLRAHSLTENVNTLSLVCGRLPIAPYECVGDAQLFSSENIGQPVMVSYANNKETLDKFVNKTYVLVGVAHSPIYLNFERGTAAIGNGRVLGFFYLPKEGFKSDYYTEAFITLDKTGPIYSDEYKEAVKSMESAVMQKGEALATLRYEEIIAEAEAEIASGWKEYEEASAEYERKREEVQAELTDVFLKLTSSRDQLAESEAQLEENEKKLQLGKTEAEKALAEIEAEKANPLNLFPQAQVQLNNAAEEVRGQLAEIEKGLAKIGAAKAELREQKVVLSEGWASYYQAKREAEDEFSKGLEELTKAEEELKQAALDLENISAPKVYALTRETNIGYVSFLNDSEIVEGISTIFPVFFFLIAALVCSTTMNRMVDDQRTQIGVLKSLGYSKAAVMSKYLIYAGSAAIIGCVLGFFGGTYVFPKVIWKAYEIMYNFADIVYVFDLPLAFISLLVSLICTVGVTWLSSYLEFNHGPAELIRPKAPQAGKRIFLEKLPFIWRKLKFLHKISARNILRYKKRLLLMILGIGGCTALLLTGFGIRDSVKNVVSDQFDGIMLYDYVISFAEAQDHSTMVDFREQTEDILEGLVFVHESMGQISHGSETRDVSFIAAEKDSLESFISLHTGRGKEIPFPGLNEAVINDKLAEELELKIGDRFLLEQGEEIVLGLTVSGINENYVGNFVYVSWDTCRNQLGYVPEIKTAYLNAPDSSDLHEVATKIINMPGVNQITINADLRERMDNMMSSLDYVVLLVILCAGTLVFIVLYNLTNINITERTREIATLKVLGFYPQETAAYVFRENFVLTILGAIIGLLPGKFMHAFVMSQIKIDIVSFNNRISLLSYILSILLTFFFAWLVNLVMRRKIHHINMAESMKSVE